MAAVLVPELYVSDLARSLAFYCGALGFRMVYERSEERFAYIERNGAEFMLEEPVGRTWLAGPLEAPFGRGFIKFDGIDGESQDRGHDKWCDVLDISAGTPESPMIRPS